MNFRFSKNSRWDIDGVTPPWGTRPSIYQHILAHIKPGEPGLLEGSEELPDETRVRGDSQIGWAAGALDGVMGHHVGESEAGERAAEVLAALKALTALASDENAAALYTLLVENSTLTYVDQLLPPIVENEELAPERLHAVARWLATGAADREPVKCAIALLGLFEGVDDRDLLLTLGRHEEFTLYAAVALGNSEEDSELSLWALACLVKGWGRIQIIERLTETNDEQIKAWMLREGYRNDIMEEYTALVCAKTGDLAGALRRPDPDEKLLRGAGSLLGTLIRGRGGPAEGIESYAEGAEAAELYLRHLQPRELDLRDFVAVSAIEQFLKEEDSAAHDPAQGWLERRENLLELIDDIRSRPGWEEMVHEGLRSKDRETFWIATEAAKVLGLDTWDVHFERVREDEQSWYFVMQTQDPARIERVIELAEEVLPLEEIATGPAEELGFGHKYRHHSALDFIVQELGRFPRKGWALIRTGLQSPVIRNRNIAVRALAAWDRAVWPVDAEPLLRQAFEAEPNEDTREMMRKTLAGEPPQLEFDDE